MNEIPDYALASDGAVTGSLVVSDPIIYEPHVLFAIGCIAIAILIGIGLSVALWAHDD